MYSTFHGLETARRGMVTHQASLYTTGHNIANANTPGYSRQRVNLAQAEPFPKPSLNRPDIPGQLGTGVHAESITRVRDQFLDLQYRNENSKYGYWAARFSALEKMEDIMNEPSTTGLANSMDKFWNALQDLSVHPEDSGARAVVRDRGKSLAETFNYVSDSLKTVQRGISEEIGGTIHNVNTILRQINNLNEQISKVEPHGYIPNDLYDRRDVLVDQLSQIVNIQVERVPSGGNASAEAEGLFTIKLADEHGRGMGITLVDGKMQSHNEFKVTYDEDTGLVDKVYIGSAKALESGQNLDTVGGVSSFTVDRFRSQGTLSAQMEAYGYLDKDGNEAGTYPTMLHDLDMMVYTFVQEFNAVHRAGWTLTDVQNGEKESEIDFFSFINFETEPISPPDYKGAASRLQVSQEIREALDNIAASKSAESYGEMEPDVGNVDELGSVTVRGTYTGATTGTFTLQIRYEESSGAWSYGIDDGTGLSWTSFPNQDDAPNFTLDGLQINVSLVDTNKLDTGETGTWSLSNLEAGEPVTGYSGDGSNALALANVKDARLNYGGSTTSVHSFYQALIGDMAVHTNEANRMMENTDILRDSVDTKRMSTSNVSLDEEFTDMVRFQHGYNAAARMITTIDQLLDRIINQMGVVGR